MSGSILNVLNKTIYEDDNIIRYDFHTHTPVSYTHLDVYKRQPVDNLISSSSP